MADHTKYKFRCRMYGTSEEPDLERREEKKLPNWIRMKPRLFFLAVNVTTDELFSLKECVLRIASTNVKEWMSCKNKTVHQTN